MNPDSPASSTRTGSNHARDSFPRITTHPLLLLLLLAAAGLVANLAMRWHLPLPFCALRELTGIPCPACGSTRSLLAWTHLDFIGAFRYNPLFFFACIGVSGWAGLRMLDRFSGVRVLLRVQNVAERLPMLRIVLSLLAVNWLYLYLTLPR